MKNRCREMLPAAHFFEMKEFGWPKEMLHAFGKSLTREFGWDASCITLVAAEAYFRFIVRAAIPVCALIFPA